MIRILIIVLTVVAICSSVVARDKTTRTGLTPASRVETAVAGDTIAAADSVVIITGYDKPLRSRVESLFITNLTDSTLEAVELTISYIDMAGRQLHDVTRWVNCDIPPRQTRQVTFSSWDRQLSFYYHLSRPPRTASVTPYDVTCTPRRLVLNNL